MKPHGDIHRRKLVHHEPTHCVITRERRIFSKSVLMANANNLSPFGLCGPSGDRLIVTGDQVIGV